MWSTVFSQMEQCNEAEVQRLLPLVSSQRREESLRFKHLAGQYACLKSYELLAQLLTDHYGVPAGTALDFHIGEHGKPVLRNYPNIHFNLSHCPRAIAVIVDDKPVGIDVERFIEPKPSLLRYTMNETEVQEVELSKHPEQTFAALWTRKEALFKYLGTGIRDNLRDILDTPPTDVYLKTSIDESNGFALTLASRRKNIEVVAAIIHRENSLLATQRGHGTWAGWWEFPGGKLESGESPEEALHRELREEMATEIHIEQLLTTLQYDYPEFHLTMHCFLCTLTEEDYTLVEHTDARWLTIKDLESVQWLPADIQLIPLLHNLLS